MDGATRNRRPAGTVHPEQTGTAGLAAGGHRFLGAAGSRHRPPQPVDFHSQSGAGLFRLDGVVGGGGAVTASGLQLQRQSAVLAGGVTGPLRRHPASVLQFHGTDLRRPPLDRILHRIAVTAGAVDRFRGTQPGHPLSGNAGTGLVVRLWGRQLCFQHGEHFFFLSEKGKRRRHGTQRGPR